MMQLLNNMIHTFENLMTAITFAEAGDHETALQMMGRKNQKNKRLSKKANVHRYVDNRPRLTV